MVSKILQLTRKINDGTGVNLSMLMSAIAFGKCPWRAPTKNSRDDANMAPFRAPNVEQATKNGIIQDITPSNLSPNVW